MINLYLVLLSKSGESQRISQKFHSPRKQQKTSDPLLISRRTKSNQPIQNSPHIRNKIWQ